MLVLRRKKGEKIIIILPDKRRIIIEVGTTCAQAASIAIQADKDIQILREELTK